MEQHQDAQTAPLSLWLRRIGWLVVLWAAGVATLGGVAWMLRAAMHAVGMR
jgi:Mg/Co/Ni transporter MgtE